MTPEGARPDMPPSLDDDLLKLLAQFDRAWQAGAGPRIEEFLTRASAGTPRRELLEELVKVDVEYRWRQPGGHNPAERPRLEEYVRRFPELGRLDRLPAALIEEEYRVRQRWGDRPGHAEYAARFPGRGALRESLARVDAEVAAELRTRETSATGPRLATAGSAILLAEPIVSAPTVPELLQLIRQGGFLSDSKLNELVLADVQGRFPEPSVLAQELQAHHGFTPYQLGELLSGRGQNLMVGPYLLMERLGEGGAGQVFKARHQKMNRIVALKLIRKELLTDADVVGRFYREIQVLSRLDHPNVVHAFDAGPAGPTHFLAMEFVEGTDLGKLVKQGGPLPVLQACAHIRQAALGLQHAYERGLVHRDIKPHNLIMSVRDGLIKVADLGLARLPRAMNEEAAAVLTGVARTTGTLTPENAAMIGTLDYLAPEQALDFHKADIRADIYSLGCTFYYLLTSQSPVAGGTLAEKLLRHQQAEPPPVEQFRKDVPAGLAAVLAKMLAKRPEDRYQTPAEVATALASLLKMPSSPLDCAVAMPSVSAAPTEVLPTASLPADLGRRSRPAIPKPGLFFAASGAVLLLGVISLALLWRGQGGTPSAGSPPSEKDAQAVVERFVRQLEGGQLTADQLPKELSALREKYVGIEEPLRQQLLAARLRCLGKPQALRVGEALMRLPSPLDRLDQKKNDWLAVLDQEGPEVAKDRLEQLGPNPFGLDFSPDGKILAVTGTDNTVRLWNLDGPKPQKGHLLKGHTDWVHAVAFSPDGQKLATGSRDKTVRLWDAATGKELARLEDRAEVRVVAITSDGKTLASGGFAGDGARLWDLTREKPQPIQITNSYVVGALTFAPDRRTIAVGGSYYVQFWDTKNPAGGSPLTDIRLDKDPRTHSSSLAYSPDGKMLCVGFWSDGWGVWDMTGKAPKKLLTPIAHNVLARAAFTPNGNTVVSSYIDGKVMVTDTNGNWETEPVPLPPGCESIHSFALASDGRHVALGDNKRKVYILRLPSQ